MTPIQIEILIALNIIGFIIALWLGIISLERRRAVIEEKFPLTPKPPRLRMADRQIRDRLGRAIFHLGAVLLGMVELLNIELPYVSDAWVIVLLILLFAIISVFDLYGEMQ